MITILIHKVIEYFQRVAYKSAHSLSSHANISLCFMDMGVNGEVSQRIPWLFCVGRGPLNSAENDYPPNLSGNPSVLTFCRQCHVTSRKMTSQFSRQISGKRFSFFVLSVALKVVHYLAMRFCAQWLKWECSVATCHQTSRCHVVSWRPVTSQGHVNIVHEM